jgi:hypothetical protein
MVTIPAPPKWQQQGSSLRDEGVDLCNIGVCRIVEHPDRLAYLSTQVGVPDA